MQSKDASSIDGAKSINGLSDADSITTLPLEFTFHGHHLRQVWRKADVAVFERSLKKGRPAHEFELVIIRTHKECLMPSGAVMPAGESYPGPSAWGKLGFSFPIDKRETVFKLAEQLVNRGEDSPRSVVFDQIYKDAPPSIYTKKCGRRHASSVRPSTLLNLDAPTEQYELPLFAIGGAA
jgi:hypothetical protein